jgi:N-acetyl-1-D-myo-inositol-2-amino-2-deoxy-alpha-D-glucopyranoside deacetylase
MAPDLSGRTLLAVFAHPDDESIACGGLLARCAELGARVVLLCATHGEYQPGVRDERLFETRARELQNAAVALGLADVILLDYPDGHLRCVDEEELERRLTAEIRRVNPDVVVTFGVDGLYWHPDHIVMHERTTAVVQSMGDDAPALYYVTMPPGQMRGLVEEWLRDPERGMERPPVFGIDPDAFGAKATEPTLIVDVAAAAGRKLAALSCHRTQVGDAFIRVPGETAARLLGTEHFHRAPIASARDAFIERL